jgi:hypothetical protein
MNELTILNFNIWFDEYAEEERTSALLACIYKDDPDVLCFQEVKPNIFKKLILNLKKYKYYYPKNITHKYGCVIFSKYKISKCLTVPFTKTSMGRELIITKIDYPCQVIDDDNLENMSIEKVEIIIATTHFESEFNRKSVNINKWSQIHESYTILNGLFEKYKNVIFSLDTNLTEYEEMKNNFIYNDNGWNDAWILKGNENNKYTFDCVNNIYLKLKKGRYRSRLDRMLFKTINCEIEDYDLVKNASNPVFSWISPSDHFGLIGKFEIFRVNELAHI